MIQAITGVILAGGKSSRMGRNKALLPMPDAQDGPRMIDRVLAVMNSLFSRVVLSVHHTGDFPGINVPEVVDRYPEAGPIGGISSVLESGETQIFCVGCDMPFLKPDLIRYICDFSDRDAVVPVWRGRPEALHSLYSIALLPYFQDAIAANRFKITDSFSEVHVKYIQDKEIKKFDPEGKSFSNINTPDDYSGLL